MFSIDLPTTLVSGKIKKLNCGKNAPQPLRQNKLSEQNGNGRKPTLCQVAKVQVFSQTICVQR